MGFLSRLLGKQNPEDSTHLSPRPPAPDTEVEAWVNEIYPSHLPDESPEESWVAPPIKIEHIELTPPAAVPDMPSRRLRVAGVGHYLTNEEAYGFKTQPVLLVRDPDNPVHSEAVAVALGDGRKIGYLSRAKAESYSPLLQQVGAIKVECYREGGANLWLTMPALTEFRKAVKSGSIGTP